MNVPVVIGVGNPLRQDDGLGRRAAQLLDQDLPPGAADVTECHQLTPELAAKFAGAPVVVFLDASVDDIPGLVRQRIVAPEAPGAWSHHLSPGQLLALAEELNGALPAAFLISGGVLETNAGDTLTPLAEGCARQMADLALGILARWNPAGAAAVPHP